MKIGDELPENIIKSREACLAHADDLVRAAKRILSDERLSNISYHLAVLALEEIGKSTLIVMGHLACDADDSEASAHRFCDDHIKKLFWATWGPSIGTEKITKDQIESLRGLSRKIHETRMQALYVDFDANGPFLPSEAISETEAQNLIDIASARLEMEKLHKFGKIEETHLNNMNWFLSASDDTEKRKLIFGNKSMEKLAELGSTHKWIAWLKQEFDKADAEAKEAIKQELQRKPPNASVKLEDKWKIKIRLFTNSHSIRPKTLNKWNDKSNWIRLYPVGGKKDQLIAEIILPKNITIQSLWWTAWGIARRFVVALNIGTFGCFWWYVPDQISRFYEKIIDLENPDMEVRIERNPILKIDWGHRALSETDLRRTALCFGMLPGENESELGKAMGAYITALAFLNKNDIHFQFEANSYEFIYKALKHGMRHFREWDDHNAFSDSFERLFIKYELDQVEIDKHKEISQRFERVPPSFDGLKLSLSEVAAIKIICDAYFIRKFDEMAKQREAEESASNTGCDAT
jgi:AbiV family abortive infection protein